MVTTTTPTLWADLGSVNTTTAGTEENAQVIGLANGNIVVAWESISGGNSQILGQIYDPLGNKIGAETTLVETGSSPGDFVLSAREGTDSHFVVAYVNESTPDLGSLRLREFTSEGGTVLFPGTFFELDIASSAVLDISAPTVASFSDGSLVVGYTKYTTGNTDDTDIAFNIVSTANVVGAQQTVDAPSLGGNDDNALNPAVAVRYDDSFVIVWDDEFGAQASDTDVFFEQFTSTGAPGGFTPEGTGVSGAGGGALENDPDVAASPTGTRFMVVWTEPTTVNGDGDGSGEGIRATLYNGGTSPSVVVGNIQVNTTTTGDQNEASVTALADNGFLIAWEDDNAGVIRAQRFDFAGSTVGEEFVILSSIGDGDSGPELTTLIDGRVAVAVTAAGGDVKVSIWDPRDSDIVATGGNDVYTSRVDGGRVFGGAGADTLLGGAGIDILNGEAGDDIMKGGGGDDRYVVDDAGDQVVEEAGAGSDVVYASLSYVLGANVESLVLVEAGGDIDGTGNGLDNELQGNSGANILIGGAGKDYLDGHGGGDTMKGGTGDDTYTVDDAGDVVDETGGTGTDLVYSSVTFSLADGTHAIGAIENLTLLGSGAFDATGNGLANVLTGNDGANTLDGGAGADTMRGGLGNDTYIVDNAGDEVNETGGGGTDTVKSSISFSLADIVHVIGDIENLTLIGSSDIDATGNAFANELTGNDGANTLDGGGNADTMKGGLGNDTYIVDNAGDVVDETGGSGTDLVRSTITFSLADGTRAKGSVENLTLTGGGAINATGNGLANILFGNGGKNILDGKASADTMKGFGGNDTYVVDNAGDVVDETGGSGTDLVRSSVSFSLADAGHARGNIEDLTLLGGGNLNATGNGLANRLTGNGGANTLDGKAGADTMKGLGGNDTYFVDNAGDVVDETGGSGTDLVKSSVSFSLADAGHAKGAIENLTLLGSGAVNGAGNALANVLTGNAAANSLFGDLGNDVMIGGGGADSFLFGTRLSASNVDIVDDFAVNVDEIGLDKTIFKKVGAKLSKKEFYINKKGKAHDKNDFVVYNKKNGDLIYDKNGSKKGGAKVFAELDKRLKLDHKDFFVYDDFVI